MYKKIGIIFKDGASNHKKYLTELYDFLEKNKKNQTAPEKSDLLIVFGGDGTILKTVQFLNGKPTPIFGVNTGGLGVLTQIKPSRLIQSLEKIFSGKYKLENRTLLEVKVNDKVVGLALNEAVIGQCAFSRLINFEISGCRKKVNFNADGVIVATPIGSGAHSYSAGGKRLPKNAKLFALTPICPSQRKQKPLTIADNSRIEIRLGRYHNDAQGIGLSLDGQKNINLQYKDTIKIQKSAKKAVFINCKY